MMNELLKPPLFMPTAPPISVSIMDEIAITMLLFERSTSHMKKCEMVYKKRIIDKSNAMILVLRIYYSRASSFRLRSSVGE